MSKPLNIGIVANTAFNIYNFRLGLINALKKEGHHVIAVAPKDEYTDLLKQNNIEFIEVQNLARKGTNPFNDLKLLNEFRKIYKQQQLDVVLQYTIKPNIYGTLASRFTNTKTICTVTGLGYTFLNKSIASKIAHSLYRLAFSFADKVLFQNNDDIEIFLSNKLVDKHKVQLVAGSGIDIQKFHPDFCSKKNEETVIANEEKQSFDSTDGLVPRHDGVVRFLMIARLLKDKGIYEYVDAAKQILQKNENVEFHILGDIDNDNPSAIKKQELDTWIKDGIIYYHEHTKDTRPFICATDCVVLPSYREGMPRVILEGMAMGKPCITTDAPGCKDAVIDGESGFLCKTADVISLKECMERFISAEKTYKIQIGINARKRAETIFSNEAVNLTYINLLSNFGQF
ncbi:MAG: glycosyltransferase family 4 protein [Chitinophagales bacterium]